jgi:glycogen debranching enzyme
MGPPSLPITQQLAMHHGSGCPFQAWSVAELSRVVKRLRDHGYQPGMTSRAIDPDSATEGSAQR